jgi:hypothetical protein
MTPRDRIVVRREPELVQREAKRLYRGDDEKVATAGFNNLNVRGVIIYSRYQKAHELETMIQMVMRLQADRIGYVERIWCDSQAGCSYNVVLRHKNLPDSLVRDIFETVRQACFDIDGGYSWFSVYEPGGLFGGAMRLNDSGKWLEHPSL